MNKKQSLPGGNPPKLATDYRPPPSNPPRQPAARHLPESWSSDVDADILEMDHFVKTISGIKSKGVRPDIVGSIIAHYSSKWLPDLSPVNFNSNTTSTNASNSSSSFNDPAASSTTSSDHSLSTKKKRFFIETIIGILPKEIGSVPCSFLLGLLRVVSNVAADDLALRDELERRIAYQLDQVTDVKELLLMPNLKRSTIGTTTSSTLPDFELVSRLVRRFLSFSSADRAVADSGGGVAVVNVARLVDSYLAEAAFDPNLELGEFMELAGAMPDYARANHDGIYRAIDTYLKAHPNMTKQERKLLCRLIDSPKFSPEASLHATHNDRLPVRTVLQVLFSEQTKLTHQLDRRRRHVCRCSHSHPISGSFHAPATSETIRKLKDDLLRVQVQCDVMQRQMEKLSQLGSSTREKVENENTANKVGIFRKWRNKIGMIPSFRRNHNGIIDGGIEIDYSDDIIVNSGILKFYQENCGGDDGNNHLVKNDHRKFGSLMGSSRRCTSMDVTRDLVNRAQLVTKRWRHSSS